MSRKISSKVITADPLENQGPYKSHPKQRGVNHKKFPSLGEVQPQRTRVKCLNRENILLCLTITGIVLAVLAVVMSAFLMINVRCHDQSVTRNELDVAIAKATVHIGTNNTGTIKTLEVLETSIHYLEQETKKIKAKMEAHNEQDTQKSTSGCTYTRWGRPDCPGNGTNFVYSGNVGGGYFLHPGAAVNYLCLTRKPTWNHTNIITSSAHLYGAQYQFSSSYSYTYFGQNMLYHEPPCAVCRSTRASVIMIPGTNVCTEGWTREYAGYLVSGSVGHTAASEYICLDNSATIAEGSSSSDHNGKSMYLVKSDCSGTLECPPYVPNMEVTCVVCTQ